MSWNFTIPIVGVSVGDSSPSGEADTWINDHFNAGFSGTLADLQALINQQSTDCAGVVHSKSAGTNLATCYSICHGKLQAKYQDKQNQLQAQQAQVQTSIDNATITAANSYASGGTGAISSKTVTIIAIAFIFVFIIILILKK